jgi:hypothetical protein
MELIQGVGLGVTLTSIIPFTICMIKYEPDDKSASQKWVSLAFSAWSFALTVGLLLWSMPEEAIRILQKFNF